MERIAVEIDGNSYEALRGSTILEIAKANGIYIPTLCYEERLSPYGACRLCLVEVEGARGLLPACHAQADDGMVIHTTSEQIERIRKTLVELLLSDHPQDCMTCESSGSCTLQDLAYEYGVKEPRFQGEQHDYAVLAENPCIERDYNKCVLCGRCIRICREVQGVGVYDFVNRGFSAIPGTPYDLPLQETPCEFCGQCISTCPTGALTPLPSKGKGRDWQAKKVLTTCPYCGSGCQQELNVIDNRVMKVTAPVMVGSNQGNLCVKGRFGYDFIASEDRPQKPLVRKDGQFVEVEWEEALDLVAQKLSQVKEESGPDAIGVFSCARFTNEENYLAQKFTRAVIGTNNIDHCARV